LNDLSENLSPVHASSKKRVLSQTRMQKSLIRSLNLAQQELKINIIYVYHRHIHMSTSVYSIRIDDRIRMMMDEMSDVNWQGEIKQTVEMMVREKNKKRLLSEAQELWKHQKPNAIGAAEMIREDRDA